MQTQTIKLEEPVQFGSQTIDELTIPPLKVKHVRGMKLKSEMTLDDMLALIGRVTQQPDSVIDDLGMNDIMKISGVLERFLESSPGSGPTA